MKLSTKNLLIILGVLLVIYAVTQLTKGSGKSSAMRDYLVAIDTTEVTRVQITSPGNEVILSKTGTEWTVRVGDGTRPVREGAVKTLINTLDNIRPSRLAAKKSENWKDYQVDSTGTDVKVYDGEELLGHLVVGRMGFENQRSFYSFVRLGDEANVYAANDFMAGSVSKTTAGFRNHALLRINKDSLRMVRFEYPDSAFKLTRNEKWFVDDQLADSAAVVKWMNSIRLTTSQQFYDDAVNTSPTHQVVFSFSNSPDLTVDGYTNEGGMILRSSQNPAEAWLDENTTKKIMKGRGAFLAN